MCKLRTMLYVLLLGTGATTVLAAPGAGSQPQAAAVAGRLATNELRRQLEAAEDRVFALFNQYNTEPLYDIRCRMEAPVGSRIPQRRCLPGFFKRTGAQQGMALAYMMRGQVDDLAPPTVATTGRHFPVLQRKMLELIEQEPELSDAAAHYQRLFLQLEASQRSKADTLQ